MTIKQQVINLKLSKKLKKLGVKQESLFYWQTKHHSLRKNQARMIRASIAFAKKHNLVSAFTVAELGEMLKNWELDNSLVTPELPYYKNKRWIIIIRGRYQGDDKSEANARAKMLIYLIENKLNKE